MSSSQKPKISSKLMDIIKMPPPKSKLAQNLNDELRKNLKANPSFISKNLLVEEEFRKSFRDFEDENFKKIEDFSTKNCDTIENNICENCLKQKRNCFENKFNINDLLNEDDDNSSLKSKTTRSNFKLKYNDYRRFEKPSNKQQIDEFVENILTFIHDHSFDSSLDHIRIKLETRYNDYLNKGLKKNYFIDTLENTQRELISKIVLSGEDNVKIINAEYSESTKDPSNSPTCLRKKRVRLKKKANIRSK